MGRALPASLDRAGRLPDLGCGAHPRCGRGRTRRGRTVVAIDRPRRFSGKWQRAAVDLTGLLLVLAPIAMLNVLVGVRPARLPGPSEVAAVIGAGVDPVFRWQLTAAQAVASSIWGTSLLQSARGLCLLAGLLGAAALWPVLRRLGLGGNAAATAVIVAGLLPIALRLQPSVAPGSIAAFWTATAAAVLVVLPRGPARAGAGGALLVVAVVTAPIAAVGLLAMLAFALLTHRVAGRWSDQRRRAAGWLAAAGALSAAAVVLVSSATAAEFGGPTVLAVLVIVGMVAVVIALSWVRRPDLQPVGVLAATWLACAVPPGAERLSALLLAVLPVALLVGGQ